MITNTREAVRYMVESGSEVCIDEIVAFLRKNPDQTYEFARGIRDSSDASNHFTPYSRLTHILHAAVKVKK